MPMFVADFTVLQFNRNKSKLSSAVRHLNILNCVPVFYYKQVHDVTASLKLKWDFLCVCV